MIIIIVLIHRWWMRWMGLPSRLMQNHCFYALSGLISLIDFNVNLTAEEVVLNWQILVEPCENRKMKYWSVWIWFYWDLLDFSSHHYSMFLRKSYGFHMTFTCQTLIYLSSGYKTHILFSRLTEIFKSKMLTDIFPWIKLILSHDFLWAPSLVGPLNHKHELWLY